MKKLILAFTFIFGISFLLTGCNNDDDSIESSQTKNLKTTKKKYGTNNVALFLDEGFKGNKIYVITIPGGNYTPGIKVNYTVRLKGSYKNSISSLKFYNRDFGSGNSGVVLIDSDSKSSSYYSGNQRKLPSNMNNKADKAIFSVKYN